MMIGLIYQYRWTALWVTCVGYVAVAWQVYEWLT